MARTKYDTTLILSDWDMNSSVNLPAGEYVDVLKLKTPAQQIRRFGKGAIENGVDNRGVFKMDLQNSSSASISGSARLKVSDANGVISRFRKESRSSQLTSSEGVRVEEDSLGAKEDSFLIIQYKADSTETADKSNSTLEIPVTIETL
jgi:hypothetical protein